MSTIIIYCQGLLWTVTVCCHCRCLLFLSIVYCHSVCCSSLLSTVTVRCHWLLLLPLFKLDYTVQIAESFRRVTHCCVSCGLLCIHSLWVSQISRLFFVAVSARSPAASLEVTHDWSAHSSAERLEEIGEQLDFSSCSLPLSDLGLKHQGGTWLKQQAVVERTVGPYLYQLAAKSGINIRQAI